MKKSIILATIIGIGGYWGLKKYKSEKEEKEKFATTAKKDNAIMETMMQWVQVEHEGKSISALLNEMNYKTIGIYGYGYLGKQLERVLLDGSIEIACVIDKKLKNRVNGDIILQPSNQLPAMDAIVVTSPFYFAEIKDELEKWEVQADIISIDALLYQL